MNCKVLTFPTDSEENRKYREKKDILIGSVIKSAQHVRQWGTREIRLLIWC